MQLKVTGYILMITWIGSCEKQTRETVLTDETKRILDIFDFSNFEKQEALSNIDRLRFENLIRGKRSKWNFGNFVKCSGSKSNSMNSMLILWVLNKTHSNKHSRLYDDSTTGTSTTLEVEGNEKSSSNDTSTESTFSENELNDETEISLFEEPLKVRLKRVSPKKSKRWKSKILEYDEDELNDDEEEEDEEEEEPQTKKYVKRRRKKKKKRHHWSKWTAWSPCSVTCGKGRKIRWRKCIVKVCKTGELEMGEKTCQLPACSLFDKLFSLF